MKQPGDLIWCIGSHINRTSAAIRIKRRHFVALVSDQRDAVCLKPLARCRQIQNDFRSGTYRYDRSACQFGQVRGDIGQRSTMNTADTASCKDLYSCTMSNPDGCRNGGSTVPVSGYGDGKITRADFSNVIQLCQYQDFVFAQTDAEFALEYRDGCRNGAGIANDLLQAKSSFQILGTRQTVRNDRGFQGN